MNTVLRTLTLFFFLFHTLNAQEFLHYTPINEQAHTKILTPTFHARTTAKIRLKNGLEAYVISDPETNQSGAALTALTGSIDDLKEAPGTAHFLEHMLFRGTEKSNESTFDEMIILNRGETNAFTTDSQTSFIFTINHNAFDEALKRFANLFKTPLLLEEDMKSEIKAIDQEYSKNRENDDIREFYVLKDLTEPTHPLHAYGMGNENALRNLSHVDLKKWYEQHYSADQMRLIVISPQPLDVLLSLVIDDFSEISDRTIQPREPPESRYPSTLHNQIVYIQPIKHVKRLTLWWDIPELKNSHPENVLCYLIGHEGNKSLLAELKREHLATELTCGADNTNPGILQVYIRIDLTEMGVKEVARVIETCFETIAVLRSQKISKNLYDEIRSLSLLNYQYQMRSNLYDQMEAHAYNLGHESLETYPEQSLIVQEYDATSLSQLLDAMTPENAVYTVLAPSTLTGVATDKTDPWFDTKYGLKAVPLKVFEGWKKPAIHGRIDLPDSNPYLPSKLTVGAITTPDSLLPEPSLILDDPSGKVYYAQDTRYGLPIVSVSLQIKTPTIDPKKTDSQVMTELFIDMVKQTFGPLFFSASTAGLSVSLNDKENGLAIALDGYGDQLPRLLDDLCLKLITYQPDEKLFNSRKKELHKTYLNSSKDTPVAQAFETFSHIIYADFPTDKQRAAHVSKITFARFQKFLKSLFKETYIEGMIFGNCPMPEAEDMVSKVIATLHSKPYPKEKQWVKQILDLPPTPYFFESKIKSKGNAALLAIETPPYTFKIRASQQILMQAIRQPFFAELRTRQQTGYLVVSQPCDADKHLFNLFIVQSNTHNGTDLIARYELFLEDFCETLLHHSFTEEQFDQVKQSLLAELTTPPKNPQEMGVVLNKLAFTYDGDFLWLQKRVDSCRDLTYEEFLTYAIEMIGKKNKQRLAIIKTGTISDDVLRYKKICSPKLIRK